MILKHFDTKKADAIFADGEVGDITMFPMRNEIKETLFHATISLR